MCLPSVLYSASLVLELSRVGCRKPEASGVLAKGKRRGNLMSELHSSGHAIRGVQDSAGLVTLCVCQAQT